MKSVAGALVTIAAGPVIVHPQLGALTQKRQLPTDAQRRHAGRVIRSVGVAAELDCALEIIQPAVLPLSIGPQPRRVVLEIVGPATVQVSKQIGVDRVAAARFPG